MKIVLPTRKMASDPEFVLLNCSGNKIFVRLGDTSKLAGYDDGATMHIPASETLGLTIFSDEKGTSALYTGPLRSGNFVMSKKGFVYNDYDAQTCSAYNSHQPFWTPGRNAIAAAVIVVVIVLIVVAVAASKRRSR